MLARAVRVALLIAVVAALGALIVDMLPHRQEASPTGSERTAPTEQPSHYNFPNYA